MTSSERDAPGLPKLLLALDVLRGQLAQIRLPLDVVRVADSRHSVASALRQFDDYLLPRMRQNAAPLLAVVGGSTGAGKSTLVNSLLGERVTTPGILRPTTRSPVLVHNPHDGHWFSDDRVLPGLARGGSDSSSSLELVASTALPRGLALIDAPDVDSVVDENRSLAAQLLSAADLWLFATTAARYADAVPWQLLQDAARKHTQVALILGRVDPGAEEVEQDLAAMLADQGLAGAPIFMIPERLGSDGLLPETAVGPLARWLAHLAQDEGTRVHVIEATRDGVVDDLIVRSREFAGAIETQNAAAATLAGVVHGAYGHAAEQVRAATSDGALLRGEVLARWQDFVGTGEFFRAVEHRIGRVRDAVTGFFKGGGRQPAVPAQQAISHSLEAVIIDAVQAADERVLRAWQSDPAAATLLADLELAVPVAELRTRVAEQIRGWQGDVLALVGEQAAGKRSTARALSLGVNGLGVSLMIVVFASTGGLTGAELGIAGGTAVLAQRVLEGVFGDDAVRRLTRAAQDQLSLRVQQVLDQEATRFLARVDELGLPAPTGPLLAAADDVESAAQAERHERASRPAIAESVADSTTEGQLRGLDAPVAPSSPDLPDSEARP